MKVVYFGGEISYSVFSWKSLDMTFYFYIKWEPQLINGYKQNLHL